MRLLFFVLVFVLVSVACGVGDRIITEKAVRDGMYGPNCEVVEDMVVCDDE